MRTVKEGRGGGGRERIENKSKIGESDKNKGKGARDKIGGNSGRGKENNCRQRGQQ